MVFCSDTETQSDDYNKRDFKSFSRNKVIGDISIYHT